MNILRSPGLSLSLSPRTLPAAHASLGFCSMQPRYRECDGATFLSRPPFLFPEVSRVSKEDGSAIKQLAVKVTDRRSRRVPLPIGGLTLFWNSMGRTFFGATLAVHPFHAPAFASVKFSWFKPYALEFAGAKCES